LDFKKSKITIMKNNLLFLVICSVASSAFQPMPTETISIIVHPDNPYDKLTPSTIRIFWLRSGKKRWDKINVAIKPIDRKGKSPQRDKFLSTLIEMKSDQVETYFSAKQYQFAEQPPAKFVTDAEIIQYVSDEPGAIGFVSSAALLYNTAKVKVVFQLDL
jgi:ABC-type phosphate transport system substrate-binding protein